ncbi:hypothetical protein [Marilutibacter aestuarii]|uniref:hypothetical protein n=1 Tax=Marilutibacter aestuarii TaxID=1706195 RepID=UPI001B85CEE8|nr:hypothetical protein [Lysobacter aestuarii]
MRHRSNPIALSLPCLFIALAACQPTPPDATADAAPPGANAPATAATSHGDEALLARGEYLVRMSGCNDCHTAGYAERQGEVDPAEWLTGSPLGYNGPWGTTYASNLRMRVDGMDEAAWLAYTANLRTRPIMPDFLLRTMAEDDRRAIYRFVKSLGPAGGPAPAYLPPGQQPPPPYMQLVLPVAPQDGPAVASSPGGR